MKKPEDLCLKCPLDDCDETSRHCLLKQAINNYQHAQRHGKEITNAMRRAYSVAHTELHGYERIARRSEEKEHCNENTRQA
jgi:hypothetical protein